MKKTHYIVCALALFLFAGSSELTAQQSKREMEKEKEKQMQFEAQEKDKALRKEMLEAEKAMKKAQKEVEIFYKDQYKAFSEIDFEFNAPEFRKEFDNYVIMTNDFFSGSQTQLTLRNSFSGGSDTSNGSFDVDEGVRRFKCNINGKVRSGRITVNITYPDGKVFKELEINSSAEISFSQTMTVKEEKADKFVGTWKYEVKAEKAEGNYVLMISTN